MYIRHCIVDIVTHYMIIIRNNCCDTYIPLFFNAISDTCLPAMIIYIYIYIYGAIGSVVYAARLVVSSLRAVILPGFNSQSM